MDAPSIQYARTDDGVNIAYWTLGEGEPVVHLHGHALSHLGLEWDVPAMRRWYERMAEARTVVRLDLRGGGLSDHDVAAIGIEEFAQDIDAVADAAAFGRFALIGTSPTGAPAIHYAVTRPDRINRLVLFDASATQGSGRAELFWRSSGALREFDPDAWARMILGQINPEGDSGIKLDVLLRDVFSADQHRGIVAAFRSMNVSQQLVDIRCPTLVVGRRDGGFGDSRPLAAEIPGAQLAYVEGTSLLPYFQDAFATIQKFLQEDGSEPEEDRSGARGGFRTILFTDIESSTALTQAVGDAKAQDVLHGHNAVVRAALAAHDGEEVKHTGDGIMASFGSAVSAVQAALQIQRDLEGGEIRVRVGINAGEPIGEDHDYFGTAVQLAARICDRAEPGQVFVSNVVRELCAGKTLTFADQGEVALKGFPEPVRLFAVAPPEDAA
jgi:class 3 adenylate cyclase